MRRLILLLPILSMGCERPVEYVEVRPHVPAELLKPVSISDRKVTTTRELATLATEHLIAAQTANAQIAAVAEIVGPQ